MNSSSVCVCVALLVFGAVLAFSSDDACRSKFSNNDSSSNLRLMAKMLEVAVDVWTFEEVCENAQAGAQRLKLGESKKQAAPAL